MCYFSVGGGKSVADIDTGGQNPYILTNSQCYHYSFCPGGGPNSIANFDGGPCPDLPPSGSATVPDGHAWIQRPWHGSRDSRPIFPIIPAKIMYEIRGDKPFHSSSFRYRLTYIDRYVINSGCVMRTGYFYPNQSRRLKM